MRKALVFQKLNIVICVLLTGVLLSSCKYTVPESKRVDVISEIESGEAELQEHELIEE